MIRPQRITRRRAILLGVVSSGMTVIAACSIPAESPSASQAPAVSTAATKPSSSGATTTPTEGNAPRKLATSLKIAAPSVAETIDPAGSLGQAGFQAVRPIYDALVTFDEKGEKIVPQLATAWQRIDPTTMEFKLRDDVRFSNGEDFTADAVRFSIERLLASSDPVHANTKSQMGSITSAEVVNSTTVRVKTKSPDPVLLNRMTMLFIGPPKYIGDGGDIKTKPVGTGPYKVTSFRTGQRIEFEAWDGSWRKPGSIKLATIDAISEPATLVAALRRGELDMAYALPPDQLPGLQRDGFVVRTVSWGACTLCSLLPSHPLMQDKRVREALNLAVNKEELLQTIQGGLGQVAAGQIIEPGMLGYRPDLKSIPFDPERAKALLRDAGASGAELSIITPATTRAHTDAVVGYLNAVGMRARTEPVELALMLRAINSGTDRPMVTWNTNYFNLRDFDVVGPRFTKDWAAPHFDNEEFTQLFRSSRVELDAQRRGEMIGQMAQIMREEFGVLFLLWRDLPVVHSKKIVKLSLPYDNAFHLSEIEKEA